MKSNLLVAMVAAGLAISLPAPIALLRAGLPLLMAASIRRRRPTKS